MKRCLSALAASLTLALAAGVETASADGNFVPSPPIVPTQSNSSDQEQIQVVPVAPQLNVQNVNVATYGDVDQGDVNNANTGQASQQENSQRPPSLDSNPGPAPAPAAAVAPAPAPAPAGAQRNDSDQSQIQIVPIAPQANVQNVNIATYGDVDQGNANNANTGQANQQQNSSKGGSARNDWKPSSGSYNTPSCGCGSKSDGGQGNWSKQEQIQVVPIAPQLNVQNVNLLTFGEVEQGNANNANTGQANQQENTSKGASAPGYSKPDSWKPSSGNYSKPSCGCGSNPTGGQSNWSKQKQIQFIPIAPQANIQNVNLLTLGDVEQGNANNANTGQANQQQNRSYGGKQQQPPSCRSNCGPPRPCECKPEPRPCQCQPEPRPCECKPEPRPCECKPEPRPCECKPVEPRPCDCKPAPTKCGCGSKPSGQSNWSKQKQIQFIPIAPQANIQNVNLLTLGNVEQGNANNANTGQANQQENTLKGGNATLPVKPAPVF